MRIIQRFQMFIKDIEDTITPFVVVPTFGNNTSSTPCDCFFQTRPHLVIQKNSHISPDSPKSDIKRTSRHEVFPSINESTGSTNICRRDDKQAYLERKDGEPIGRSKNVQLLSKRSLLTHSRDSIWPTTFLPPFLFSHSYDEQKPHLLGTEINVCYYAKSSARKLHLFV